MQKINPIVKWAGGKRQLLDELLKYIPSEFDTYYEPFFGGGALFLSLLPKKSVINDLNKELINLYKTIKTKNPYNLMLKKLKEHEKLHSRDYYYYIRDMDRDFETFNKLKNYERAARTLYLNKSCFNGLYRVNKSGHFNVPFNKKTTVVTYEEDNMDNLHDFLIKTETKMSSKDYKKVVKEAKSGDFVYFDPPYDTLDDKETFTSYTKSDFGKKEQKELSEIFTELTEKGVKVMLSNHNTRLIRELYKDFNIHVVQAKRMINSDANGRGTVEEVIITNYDVSTTSEDIYYQEENIKLILGDSFRVLKEIKEKSINFIFADPPYFLSGGGITCQGGKMVDVNKAVWDTQIKVDEKMSFNDRWIKECEKLLKDDGTIAISGTFHNIYIVGVVLEKNGFDIINNITWRKLNPPPNISCRALTHSTETILWAKKRGTKHKFNYKLIKSINNNRQMKDVWESSLTKKSEKKEGKHPTQKPLWLLERLILMTTDDGDMVLDPFNGSGTTGLACKKLGRKYIGIDNVEEYLEISKKRIMGFQVNKESV